MYEASLASVMSLHEGVPAFGERCHRHTASVTPSSASASVAITSIPTSGTLVLRPTTPRWSTLLVAWARRTPRSARPVGVRHYNSQSLSHIIRGRGVYPEDSAPLMTPHSGSPVPGDLSYPINLFFSSLLVFAGGTGRQRQRRKDCWWTTGSTRHAQQKPTGPLHHSE